MNKNITASKFSVSIPADLTRFLEQYQKEHGLSRSEAITKGLKKLREQELANAYRDHAQDWQNNPDKGFWDIAALDDGLDSDESGW